MTGEVETINDITDMQVHKYCVYDQGMMLICPIIYAIIYAFILHQNSGLSKGIIRQ